MLGQASWEEAESALQKQAARLAMEKAGPGVPPVRYLFSGDLLGQLIATSFGVMDLKLPLFGLYGACSTIGEALMLGAMTVQGGYSDAVLALTSSHFGSAEKQFRFPLAYGNQRREAEPLCWRTLAEKPGSQEPRRGEWWIMASRIP